MTIFYTAPTAIRACIKWGAEHPEKHDLSHAAAARHGRRADQPEGLALVPQGHRRRALPDRRHVVADRDRRHHDHDAARACSTTKPGSAGKPLPGIDAAGRRRVRRRGRRHRAGPAHAAPAVAGDAAHALQGRRPLRRDLLGQVRPRRLLRRRRRAQATRTATSGSSGASTTSSTSPATGSRPPRSSPRSSRHEKVAEAAVIGQAGRGHRPVDHRVRHALGQPEASGRGHGRRAARARRRPDRQARPAQAHHLGRRPGRGRWARSCGGCCATSRRARSSAT